ncbi:Uncharacterised protein [uncultured Eubacterium sp.]|nr:Uncharacterised protein [uncultured Eubacterium sp.]
MKIFASRDGAVGAVALTDIYPLVTRPLFVYKKHTKTTKKPANPLETQAFVVK